MNKRTKARPLDAQKAALRMRRRIEKQIERHLDAAQNLIEQLDAMDGDADREPSLGALEPTFSENGGADYHRLMLGQIDWAKGDGSDLERENYE